jgi:anti-anti-sigma factor
VAAASLENRSRRHLCAIARSDAARADIAADWIAQGLRLGEQVVWVEPVDGTVREWLRSAGVDWSAAEASGGFQTVTPEEVLLLTTADDIPVRIAAVAEMARAAEAAGYKGLRLGWEVAEVLHVVPDVPTQLAFEAAWELLTLTEQLSLMCVYDPRLDGAHVARGIALHPRELSDGLVRATALDGTVHLAGEMDLSNGTQVRAFLDAATPDNEDDILVDSSGCTFMDVAGASALLAFARDRAPRRVRVTAAPSSLRRILELTGSAHELDLVSPAPGR